MRIILSPEKIQGNSLLNLMIKLKDIDVVGELINNSLVYEPSFVECWLRTLNVVYPQLDLIGNSFIQASTLKSVSEVVEIFIYTSELNEKYRTGNQYLGLYNQLKKERISNLFLRDIHLDSLDFPLDINTDVLLEDLLLTTIIIWKEIHMGEITDAIAKAIMNASKEVDTPSVSEDRIKQAMANIGMPVENHKKQVKTKENIKADDISKKSSQSKSGFMNEPVDEESESDDINEICCKISGKQLVIMIPHGAEFKKVNVAGTEFDTITVELPDVNSSKLQILSILSNQPSEDKPTIVRTPIFLDKDETPKKTTVKKPENVKDLGGSPDIEDLKSRKAELDSAIKQARDEGNEELVTELRKQRRKIRSEINKL